MNIVSKPDHLKKECCGPPYCCEEFGSFAWQFDNYPGYRYCPYCGAEVVVE